MTVGIGETIAPMTGANGATVAPTVAWSRTAGTTSVAGIGTGETTGATIGATTAIRIAGSTGCHAIMHRADGTTRSEEHTSELQSLMRNSYAVFRLKKNT